MSDVETISAQVALIQMPFAVTSWPSLGLGLLKSALHNIGVPCRVLYFNALFADKVGEDAYVPLSLGEPQNTDLLGEWVFSEAVWGPSPERDRAYFEDVLLGGHAGLHRPADTGKIEALWAKAWACRERVADYLDECIAAHDWMSYRAVGFTSVFQQHLPSLALAKRLKAQFPHLTILMGGSNCEGPMGLATLASFPFLDAVCIGEGDTAFPAFIQDLIAGRPHQSSNIVTRAELAGLAADGQPAAQGPAETVDMNALPFPDFDDFFEQCEHRLARETIPVKMIFETSRGCWWGQKNHCTFCGLNGTTMAFRHKSAERAMEEVEHLLNRYGHITKNLAAADNIIPYKYFEDFLPALAKRHPNLSLFYETKANLKKEQLEVYRDAGLLEIQPGIESLDTTILRLMKKGVSGIQNVQLLKWCRELGITTLWNYLYGFPGEDPAAYKHTASQMKLLSHLEPPNGDGRLRFDRFSPYVSKPETYGVRDLKPYPAYEYIYAGLTDENREGLAYYFTGAFSGQERVDEYSGNLKEAIRYWRHKASTSMLAHIIGEDSTVILDGRLDENAQVITLKGLYHKVFAQTDAIISIAQLQLLDVEHEQLESVLSEMGARGLIFVEGDKILRLPVPLVSNYEPTPEALGRFKTLLSEQNGDAHGGSVIRIEQRHLVSLET